MTSDRTDLEVELPGTAPLITRLQSLLHAPQQEDQATAETARGWLDLAYEAAYGERYSAAAQAAEAGLEAPGGQDTENRLMLLRILSGVHEMHGDSEGARPHIAERIALLRRLGRNRQADTGRRSAACCSVSRTGSKETSWPEWPMNFGSRIITPAFPNRVPILPSSPTSCLP